jgi:hypothetical protein
MKNIGDVEAFPAINLWRRITTIDFISAVRWAAAVAPDVVVGITANSTPSNMINNGFKMNDWADRTALVVAHSTLHGTLALYVSDFTVFLIHQPTDNIEKMRPHPLSEQPKRCLPYAL